MLGLVYNEILKVVRKKRFYVVLAILAVLIPVFTYAQYKTTVEQQERLGTKDWRIIVQQEIVDLQNRLTSARLSDEWRRLLQIRLQQRQYYLEHDINPLAPGAVTFARVFLERSASLFVPLLVVVVAADMVSGEHTGGTIKLLLTRPVRRWKILLSKYLALQLFVSLIIAVTVLLAYLISGVVFGYGGWTMPVLTGFQVTGEGVLTDRVHVLPQGLYLLMQAGLVWYATAVVATLSFLLSVLLRSTAAAMGTMLSALIAGVILTEMVSSWQTAKYLFVVNLQLTDYLAGNAPPIEGMTLPFSLAVLGVWGAAALLASFWVFTRQDMLT